MVDSKAIEKKRLTEIFVDKHNRKLQQEEQAKLQKEQIKRDESKQELITTLEI